MALFTGFVAAEDAGGTLIGDAARACDANSFTATTLVTMADGSKRPISRVRLGDLVLATDPQTGETAPRPVTALIVHGGRHVMVDVTLADGSTITATDHHPFWDATTRSFTYADHLHLGDQLVEANGALIRIAGLRVYHDDVTAYNLTVDGIHTYYAGTTPVLVHNSCLNMSELPRAAIRNISKDEDYALQRLAEHHGVTEVEFGTQVHAIKAAEGLGPAFDLGFGPTGDVWNPLSGDLIGRIIHGG